jgi:fructose-1,6-bisphosphatase/sedoheptulose 1,7-bisphosphatase-like protein
LIKAPREAADGQAVVEARRDRLTRSLVEPPRVGIVLGDGLELDHRPPSEAGEDLGQALEGRLLELALNPADRRLAGACAPRQRSLADPRADPGLAQ